MSAEQRFKDLAADYELFKLADPHYDQGQREFGKLLRKEIQRRFPAGWSSVEVLEIGFGTGITSKVIMGADPRIHLTAIDNDPQMHAIASEELAGYISRGAIDLREEGVFAHLRRNLKRLEGYVGNYHAIVSGHVLHNLTREDRKYVLEKISRSIPYKGFFINLDKVALDDETQHARNVAAQLSRFDIFDKIGRSDLKEKWTSHYQVDEEPDRILKEGEFVSDLKEAGFKKVIVPYRKEMEAIVIAYN